MDGGRSPFPGVGPDLLRARWTRGRLVPRERVNAVLGLAFAGAVVTGVLGWRVDGTDQGGTVDDAVEHAVKTVVPMGRGVSRALGEFVADLGSPVTTTLLMIAAAVFAYLRCGPRALALVLVGPPIAMILQSTILKPLIGRTRGDELAFPSGHTTSVTSIAVALAVIVLSIPLTQAWRRGLLTTFVVVPVAVAVCLVGRDYHYPTDTVGAVGLCLAVVPLAAVILDAMADSMADEPLEGVPADHEFAGSGPSGPEERQRDDEPQERAATVAPSVSSTPPEAEPPR
jgi:undecaprenyl-diphosphatase